MVTLVGRTTWRCPWSHPRTDPQGQHWPVLLIRPSVLSSILVSHLPVLWAKLTDDQGLSLVWPTASTGGASRLYSNFSGLLSSLTPYKHPAVKLKLSDEFWIPLKISLEEGHYHYLWLKLAFWGDRNWTVQVRNMIFSFYVMDITFWYIWNYHTFWTT